MDKLNEIISRCKADVHLDINDHKAYYQTVKCYLAEDDMAKDIGTELTDEIIKNDNVIKCQFYPDTPGGFHTVFHYDLDKCLDEVIRILNDRC